MDVRAEKLRRRLAAADLELLALVADMTSTEAARMTANLGWTVKDLLAHSAAAERGHQQVIRALLAGTPTAMPGFDLDTFNEQEVAARRGYTRDQVLDELAVVRVHTVSLLDAVDRQDWDLAGRHPGGFDTTVEGTFRVTAIHERRHARDIRASVARCSS